MKIGTKNIHITALIITLTAGIITQLSWSMVSQGTLATQRAAQQAAQRTAQQLYPIGYQATRRLGAADIRTGSNVPGETPRDAMLRNQQQAREARARLFAEQARADLQASRAAQLTRGESDFTRELITRSRPTRSPWGTSILRGTRMVGGQQLPGRSGVSSRSFSFHREGRPNEHTQAGRWARTRGEYESATYREFLNDLENYKRGMFVIREQGESTSRWENGRLVTYAGRAAYITMGHKNVYQYMVNKWGQATNPQFQDVNDKYMDKVDNATFPGLSEQQQQELERMKQAHRRERELRQRQKQYQQSQQQQQREQRKRDREQKKQEEQEQKQEQLDPKKAYTKSVYNKFMESAPKGPYLKEFKADFTKFYERKIEYGALVKKWHPDINRSEQATDYMAAINALQDAKKEEEK